MHLQPTTRTLKTKEKLLNGKKVLLLEDDEVSQMLLRYMLEDQGAEMTLETSKDSALVELQKQTYDLLLIDSRIEQANTFDFTKTVKEKLKLDIPIIGLSSVDMRGRGIFNGLDAILRRPVEYPNFINTLKKLFR